MSAAGYRSVIGLDLGRQVDPSALALLRWYDPAPPRPVAFAPPPPPPPRPAYEVPTLQRWPLGTPYTQIVAQVARFLLAPPLCGSWPVLVVDSTGVGAAVAEMALATFSPSPWPRGRPRRWTCSARRRRPRSRPGSCESVAEENPHARSSPGACSGSVLAPCRASCWRFRWRR
jgi:hypothetical protein